MARTLLLILAIFLSKQPATCAISYSCPKAIVANYSTQNDSFLRNIDSTTGKFNSNIRPYQIATQVGLLAALVTSTFFLPLGLVLCFGGMTMAVLTNKKKRQLQKLHYTTAPTRKEIWQSIGWALLWMGVAVGIGLLLYAMLANI